MKQNCRLMTLLSMMLISGTLLAQSDAVLLKYKFHQGETLQYKSENHDSTSMDMGGQSNTMSMTRHSIHSLQINQTPPDNAYKITVKTDTTWSDMDMGNMQRRGNRNRGREAMEVEMDSHGKSTGREDLISPFILPLPDHPVNVNDIWHFELTKKLTGRAKGEQTVKGQCQIYQITEENGQQTAVIIVNTESHTNTAFKGNFNGRDFSMTNVTAAVSQKIVFFDVDKGRVKEVVGEGSSESTSEGTQSGTRSSVSKSTIRLITD